MTENNGEPIVACCGLVCSECGAYKKKKCLGCYSDKPMYRNCPVKKCVIERNYVTCADCTEFAELKHCKKLNSFVSKIFGLIFKSNRIGNCNKIRANGMEQFKADLQSINS